jgi:hypothetical protein
MQAIVLSVIDEMCTGEPRHDTRVLRAGMRVHLYRCKCGCGLPWVGMRGEARRYATKACSNRMRQQKFYRRSKGDIL